MTAKEWRESIEKENVNPNNEGSVRKYRFILG